jgi:hypothetical protein
MPFNSLAFDLLTHLSSFIHDKSLFYLLITNKHFHSFVNRITLDLSNDTPVNSINPQLKISGIHLLLQGSQFLHIPHPHSITKLRFSFYCTNSVGRLC